MNIEDITFNVAYSEEDGEWVATTPQFPSLSWLEQGPTMALRGLWTLLARDVLPDLESTGA